MRQNQTKMKSKLNDKTKKGSGHGGSSKDDTEKIPLPGKRTDATSCASGSSSERHLAKTAVMFRAVGIFDNEQAILKLATQDGIYFFKQCHDKDNLDNTIGSTHLPRFVLPPG